jgi:hypothetical protein
LRASGKFRGFSGKQFSTEQRIIVMAVVTDTSPEDFVENAASALLVAQNVNEVSQFFYVDVFSDLERSVTMGTSLAEWGQIFKTARLNWKTEHRAEFKITITRLTGEIFSSLLILQKDPETRKWKIVSF